MLSYIKRLIKSCLLPFGFKIGKIPAGDRNKYGWLEEYKIKNVIDIGANTGQFATEIRKWLPGSRIDSFEPLQDVFKQLVENTACFPEICVHNLGLGAQDSALDMQRNDFTPASSLLEMTDSAKSTFSFACNTALEKIQVRTLDGLLAEGVIAVDNKTLIKMDVQGYEAEVIKGGHKAISQAGIIICEVCFVELYKGQATFRELVKQIEQLGFELSAVWDIDMSGIDGFPVAGDAIFFRCGNS